MGKFGWSYPPGCSGTPYDEDYPCLICMQSEYACTCPECGVCGAVGDPACYDDEGHGLRESVKQQTLRHTALQQHEADALAELEYMRELAAWEETVSAMRVERHLSWS